MPMLTPTLVLIAVTGPTVDRPAEVEHALSLAGENRAELERVLEHYEHGDDGQKLEAAHFLIGHMEGHGYAELAFFDADGNEVEFDALAHPDYGTAREAFEALEKVHGPLSYKSRAFHADLETITADYLIRNVDLAFEAWRGRPWAAEVSFEVFLEHILPYRCSNEPVEDWRQECMNRFADITGKLGDPSSLAEAGGRVLGKSRGWVRFRQLYYLHPTDQGFSEMLESRAGRCEDMSNMMGYACRANAVVAAQDYTPYWANRDNNHAWEVLLDENGHGRAGLSNRAAKVYRKTYSAQPDALGTIKTEDERVPRWLSRKTYKDVTTDYLDTTDVEVALTVSPPDGHRFAYICVFNGGHWRAIHYGHVEGGRVTFTRMGPGIAYLPAYFVDEELVPAAPPFTLTGDGTITILDGPAATTTPVTVTAEPDDTGHPQLKVKPGRRYELQYWDGEWKSLGLRAVDEGAPTTYEGLPEGRLYWLVAEGSRRLERIFTLEEGNRRGW